MMGWAMDSLWVVLLGETLSGLLSSDIVQKAQTLLNLAAEAQQKGGDR